MPRFFREQKAKPMPPGRIMLHFLVPYATFLLTSLLVGFLVNQSTLVLLEKQAVENNYALLEQSRRSLDLRMAEISSMTQFVSSSAPILDFQDVTEPFKGGNVIQVLETRDTMIDFPMTNNFILDYYVLYRDSDIALAPRFTYRIDDFLEAVFQYPDMSGEQWRTLLFDQYHNNTYLPARQALHRYGNRPIVACLKSLDHMVTSRGVVLVLIDEAQVQSILAGLNLAENGWAYIADAKGNIISSLSTAPDWPGPDLLDLPESGYSFRKDDLLITYTISDYNQWRFVVAQPYESVVQEVTAVGRTILILFFAFVLLGILIAVLLAYWHSRPIAGIIQAIRGRYEGPEDVRKAYSLIQSTLSSLMVNNEALRHSAEEQLPILRDSFFRRLFNGEIQSEEDLKTWMRHVGLNIRGNAFGVIMVHLKGYQGVLSAPILEELAMKRLLVREALNDASLPGLYIHDTDQNNMALLITCDTSTRQAWEKTARSVIQCFDSRLVHDSHLILSCYVGDVHASLLDAALSYKEARSLMNFVPPEGWNRTVWYWDFPRNIKSYAYPEEVELRLSNLVRAGMRSGAAALLDELARENLHERQLSPATVTVFLYELLGTLTKLLEQIPLGDRSVKAEAGALVTRLMDSTESPQQLFDAMREQFLDICSSIDERKKSHNSLLVDEILAYLEEHYQDPNLCLSSVARHFNLSEVYLSQFFKEQTGENFSVRLEQLRMGKALDILRTTSHSVKEIAGMVGYNSSNTFCRAFKRIHHVSAMQYRDTALHD